MKMSHFLLVALIGVVCYFRLHPAPPIEHAAVSASPLPDASGSPSSASSPQESEEATAKYLTAPQIVREVAERNHISLDEAMDRVAGEVKKTRTFHLCGEVIQHLEDGHILVRHSSMKPPYNLPLEVYALWGFDDPLADDEPIECEVVPTTLYTYRSVDGGTRTVYEAFYCPRANEGAAAAAASAAPGAWMWQSRGNPLDRGAYKDSGGYVH